MVISSIGYPGTIDAVQWAQSIFRIGSARYGVDSLGAWRVQATAGTRAVQVPAGSGWGHGVRDLSDSPETLTLASVPTGTRWDMIVAHRDWGTGETSFEVVEGGSSRAVPTRDDEPGVIDDQPIALVRVDAGSSVVGEIVDLRVLSGAGGAGAQFAFDALALSYLTEVGTEVRVGARLWRRVVNSIGAPEWEWTSALPDLDWAPIVLASGWSAVAGHTPRTCRRSGIVIQEGAVLRGAGGDLESIGVVAAPMRPEKTKFVGASVAVRPGSAAAASELIVTSAGVLAVGAGSVYSQISSQSGWTIPIGAQYIQEL